MFFSHKEVPYYAGNPHPLQFNSVEFRDGQQSLFATRMTTDEMIPLLEEMDEVGFATMEMWGGATFDVCIRYLQEDAAQNGAPCPKPCRLPGLPR